MCLFSIFIIFILILFFCILLTAVDGDDISSVCMVVSCCKYRLGWVVLLWDTVR